MPDRVLVRRSVPERQPKEAQLTQAITDHELHPCIRQDVLRFKDQRLEHDNRSNLPRATLGPIAVAEPFDQLARKIIKVHRLL